MAGGFTDEGLAALDAALARHASSGAVPGLVALVARGGQVHVTTAGHLAAGDPAPIGRDAIFRIASLTKPLIGATAMLLIQDGAMALDDPVDRWLPELSGRRVLRSHDAELSDTVPAARPVTVEDVLSFRLGFGCIFTPQALPVSRPRRNSGSRRSARRGRRRRSLPTSGSPGSAASRCSTSRASAGGTTRARPSPGSSSSGLPGRRSPRCSASGCSSRSA